jgi:hypothetical protein
MRLFRKKHQEDASPRGPQGTLIGRVGNPQAGEKRSYAVAYAEGVEGSIIFSLDPPTWDEQTLPAHNDSVCLEDVRWKAGKGWYARKAYFLRPERRT